jgi:hypothetical protein
MQIRKTQSLELIIQGVSGGNTQTVFNFVPQPYLQGKCMSSLEVFSPTDVSNAPSGNALLPAANMDQAFITLYFYNPDPQVSVDANGNKLYTYDQVGGQYIINRPLWTFHRISNLSDPFVFAFPEMAGQVVFWEKSFVSFASGFAPMNTTTLSVLFDVGYYDPQNA